MLSRFSSDVYSKIYKKENKLRNTSFDINFNENWFKLLSTLHSRQRQTKFVEANTLGLGFRENISTH